MFRLILSSSIAAVSQNEGVYVIDNKAAMLNAEAALVPRGDLIKHTKEELHMTDTRSTTKLEIVMYLI